VTPTNVCRVYDIGRSLAVETNSGVHHQLFITIARAREVVVDFLAGSNEYGSTGPSLQKYLDHFAIAARRAHLAV
jgi:hypothetical protein